MDIAPKRAAGTALGFVGFCSYLGASSGSWLSGKLINSAKTVVGGQDVYDFSMPIGFWIGSSVLSMLLALTVWNAKARE